ncbi:MAG: endopeptidase La [Clostridiales bacterium]|nr:endopeptidase La [Clostridiales bacterium]
MEDNILEQQQIILPAMAMRGVVVFPDEPLHFDVGREKSILALKKAVETDRRIFLVTQKEIADEDPDMSRLYKIGVVATIEQMLKGADNAIRVLVSGAYRAKLIRLEDGSYLTATVEPILEKPRKAMNVEKETAFVRLIKEAFSRFASVFSQIPKELEKLVYEQEDLETLIRLIISQVPFSYTDKQLILEENSLEKKAKQMNVILERETEIFTYENDMYNQVRANIDERQREISLREQQRVIAEQLGEYDPEEAEASEYEQKIVSFHNMSDEVKQKLLKEVEKLNKMPSMSQEAAVIRGYLDTCLELPWDKYTKDKVDIKKARAKLDHDHYGMQKVKERVLEILAVRKLAPDMRGQIICLVGPPGVGKTSIARSIAEAIGRKYVRISLGGVRDESDIRGHRKTYIGSMPGRIINALVQAKSRNPVFLLDEIDKMGNDFKGDPSAAMLEVLDSEQNSAFRDHYIEVPFDLSEVLFITTANTLDTIPAPLLDRMEIIELSSYTREEKYQIAKRHLVKKQMKKHGLTAKQLKISDEVLYDLIDYYTRESGVRKLERQIAALCRKAAKEIVEEQNTAVKITEENLEAMLGPKKYRPDTIEKENQVGVVNGLAWTAVGGEMLEVEVSVLDGTGKLELTGSLGDVMKESAKTAISFVRSVAGDYHIATDFYKTKDIHIHVPEGAVPKDGPSAGVTITTALVSALSGAAFKHDYAMTGEVTLRGRVLEIGGLREKSMAAYRAGVKTVLIPKGNVADLAEIDDIVKENITFIPCDNVRQVLSEALIFDSVSASDKNKQNPQDNLLLPPVNGKILSGNSLNC